MKTCLTSGDVVIVHFVGLYSERFNESGSYTDTSLLNHPKVMFCYVSIWNIGCRSNGRCIGVIKCVTAVDTWPYYLWSSGGSPRYP